MKKSQAANPVRDDFLAKPINRGELLAHARSLLRVKSLHDAKEGHVGKLAEWKKLEVRLAQEPKLAEVAGVLRDVSHEVKNLLMPIVTGTGLLQEELKQVFAFITRQVADKLHSSEKLREKIGEMLQGAANRLHEHVQEIADCVKNLSSAPAFSPCHLATVAMGVVGTLRLIVEKKGVPLRVEDLGDLPPLSSRQAAHV